MKFEQKVLTYKGKIVFEKRTLPYFKRLPKQFFEEEACFIFVNRGAFSVRSQTEFLSFKKGSGLLAKCLNYFFETTESQRKEGDWIEVIGVLFYPSIIQELFQFDLALSNHTVNYNLKQLEIDVLLDHFKESIIILIDNPELADEAMIGNKLKELVLLLSKIQRAPSQLDFLAAMFKPEFHEFKTIIQKNLYSDLSSAELAALCHMSVSSFKRKFQETFKESPKKYIAKKKTEKAAKLLVSTDMRISDIAYDCGYESIASFNRNFKLQFGTSPSSYRLSHNDQLLS
ncbi:MAG: AraC family transcriptional regulator [Saprospiraceae bacterium]|nr:AraC family transcriptional regulator [Saprospiraceae bacterium]